jgi:hypothetical protein
VPFSADNPNRNRNYVILVLAAVVLFAVIMGGYVTLSLAMRNTDDYLRFLTVLVVTLVPSTLSAWNSYKAKIHAEDASGKADTAAVKADVAAGKADAAAEETHGIAEQLNGALSARMEQANRDTMQPGLLLQPEGGNDGPVQSPENSGR